jgi:hypothetical protein
VPQAFVARMRPRSGSTSWRRCWRKLPTVSEVAPLFADLLSIPAGERYPALDLTPQMRKEKTLAALAAQVEGLATREPVLMVYEDVHWCDPTTRESLDLLIGRVPRQPILALITFRPEFSPPWVGRPHVTTLMLNRLPPQKRAEMITYVTGGKALPSTITEQIVDRTDGYRCSLRSLRSQLSRAASLPKLVTVTTSLGPSHPSRFRPPCMHHCLRGSIDSRRRGRWRRSARP